MRLKAGDLHRRNIYVLLVVTCVVNGIPLPLQFIKILLILLDVVLVLAKTRQGTSAINGMR